MSVEFKFVVRLSRNETNDEDTEDVFVNINLVWTAKSPVLDFENVDLTAMARAIATEKWNRKFFDNLKE